jgi:hypothetical protein
VKIFAILVALCALPAAAAVSVTNLDTVTHQVVLAEAQGSKITRVVAPDQTIRIATARGHIFIQAKPEHVLSIDHLDRLVIWPEGNLQVQMRRKTGGQN